MDEKENVIDQRLILLRRRWQESPWSNPDQPLPKRQESQRLLTVAISREAGQIGSVWGQELLQSEAFSKPLEGLIKQHDHEGLNP